jgi:hypothetical protein
MTADPLLQLKCDELTPACGRCTRLGVCCPGYAKPPLKWSTKYEKHHSKKTSPLNDATESVNPEPEISVEPVVDSSAEHWSEDAQSENQIGFTPIDETDRIFDLDAFDSPLATNFDRSFADFLDSFPVFSPEEANFGSDKALSQSPHLELPRWSQSMSTSPRHETFSDDNISPKSTARSLPTSLTCLDSSMPSTFCHAILFRPTRGLNDIQMVLVEYYFKEVAGLFSCYDSAMNPFRTTVSRLWDSSPAICYTLQSMAAACLADHFPHLGLEGVRLRRQATVILEEEPKLDDRSLLALLMLGQTASWHDPKDLGISFFNKARRCLGSILSESSSPSFSNNIQFFQEALIYWEMLLSYVTDDFLVSDAGAQKDAIALRPVPHPWTGFARDAQSTVQEVGKLVRSEMVRIRTRRFASQADIDQSSKAINSARILEERLLNLSHPGEPDVVSPDDGDTPVWHLLTIAEVYRRTGLMQLYRAFPDLLCRRLPQCRDDQLTDFNSEIDLFQLTGEGTHDTFQSPNDWLSNFALSTLALLKSIPLESRTRCLQPFLLVACSSELRYSSATTSRPIYLRASEKSALETSLQAIEVSRMRNFVLGRLTSYLHVLPPKPIHVCLELVRGTWAKMDAGEEHVYWVDVMIQNGWETTMG